MKCIVNSFGGERLFQRDFVASVKFVSTKGCINLLTNHENFEGMLKSGNIILDEYIIQNVVQGVFKISDNNLMIVCDISN